MGVTKLFYHYVLRKNSTFWPFIVATAFAAEAVVDSTSESLFDSYNKGVSGSHPVITSGALLMVSYRPLRIAQKHSNVLADSLNDALQRTHSRIFS